MSCSVCLMPFHPAPTALDKRLEEGTILNNNQKAWFQYGIAVSDRWGEIKTLWFGNNNFGAAEAVMVMMMVWAVSEGWMEFIGHTTCMSLLRHAIEADTGDSLESLVKMCSISEVLGMTKPSKRTGISCLPGVDHVKASGLDIERLWNTNGEAGNVVFHWDRCVASGLAWTVERPDSFPRFHPEVAKARLASLGTPVDSSDILTTLPVDVLIKLCEPMDAKTYVAFMSTCRLFRGYAIRDFQHVAQAKVKQLQWALPLLNAYAGSEYTNDAFAHPTNSPPTGDWYLYLSHVHRAKGMRVRRRIWNICEELRRVYDERYPESEYCKNPVKEEKLRMRCKQAASIGQMMNGKKMGGLGGFGGFPFMN